MKRILILATALIAVSCSRKITAGPGQENQRWVAIEINGTPVLLTGDKEIYIVFSPQDNRFAGHAGCNRISGNYTLKKKDQISFSEVISTKMSCSDISLETAFLAALSNATGYEVRDNALLLSNGSGVVLKFRPGSRN